MKNPVYILLVAFSWLTTGDDQWVPTRVDKVVSVRFPGKPDKEKSARSIVFTSDNDNCVFMVTAAELIPASVEVKDVSQEQEDKFLTGVLNGSLRAYEGKEDGERKDFTINNVQGKEMSYIANFPTTDIKMKSYKRVFRIGRTVYALDCWIIESETEEALADKDKFFNSVTAISK